MAKINIYSSKGVKKGDATLPKEMQAKTNKVLLAQAVRVYEDNTHPGLAKVLTRGEMGRSTRKIYRQKGTGGARHGARSAPIFVGGGIAHGPQGVKRKLSLSKKISKLATLSALNLKAELGMIVAVEGLTAFKKTKEVQILINQIVKDLKLTKKVNTILLALKDYSKEAVLAFRNIKGLAVMPFKSLNAYQILSTNVLILDGSLFEEPKKEKVSDTKAVKAKKVAVKSKKTVTK